MRNPYCTEINATIFSRRSFKHPHSARGIGLEPVLIRWSTTLSFIGRKLALTIEFELSGLSPTISTDDGVYIRRRTIRVEQRELSDLRRESKGSFTSFVKMLPLTPELCIWLRPCFSIYIHVIVCAPPQTEIIALQNKLLCYPRAKGSFIGTKRPFKSYAFLSRRRMQESSQQMNK